MLFSEVIKNRRVELNMSPTELAYKSKMSVSYISHLENGTTAAPSPEKAFILAEALKIPPQDLVWLSVIEKLSPTMRSKVGTTITQSKPQTISVDEAIEADEDLSAYSKKTLKEMYLMLRSTDTRQRQMLLENK